LLRVAVDKVAPRRLDEITQALEAALAARFGSDPIRLPFHAILFGATVPSA
jgi:hypothetical protein